MMSYSYGASRPRRAASAATVGAAALLSSSSSWARCHGFNAAVINDGYAVTGRRHARPLCVYAPPGSGYVRSSDLADDDDDDEDIGLLTRSDVAQISPPAFPSTYEPMLEYPGTMRPGRTPENMPYHDLPNLGIDDPDPVPWPHFQEIDWHHRWAPPHPQALAMEEYLSLQGRWASVEDEAEMRMGMRRGVRERRETEELTGKGGGSGAGGAQQMVIMDDEEEEEGGVEGDERNNMGIRLGEGVEALLKTAADNAADGGGSEDDEDNESEDASDDFLLDLGLGGNDDENEGAEEGMTSSKRNRSSKNPVEMETSQSDGEDDLDLDFELGFDVDDHDDEADEDAGEDEDFDDYDDSEDDISLDDYTKEDDGGDDDEFDDGGFDYGD